MPSIFIPVALAIDSLSIIAGLYHGDLGKGKGADILSLR
jgi:hypothetical protein